MLSVLGAAVAMILFEASAILMSTGLCARNPKLERRGGKRYGADVGYGRRGGNGTVDAAGGIFASGLGDGDGDDYGGTDGAGSDRGGKCRSLQLQVRSRILVLSIDCFSKVRLLGFGCLQL